MNLVVELVNFRVLSHIKKEIKLVVESLLLIILLLNYLADQAQVSK